MSSRLPPAAFATTLAFGLAACQAPMEAPSDLNAVARFLFAHFDPAEGDPAVAEVELRDAITKVGKVIDGDHLAEPKAGLLEDVTSEELAAVGIDDGRNPAVPQGMFIADIIHCSMDRLEQILLDPDQKTLYPGVYADYQRAPETDSPDFLPRWTTTYRSAENGFFSNQYTAVSKGAVRRIAADASAGFESRALMQRIFMPQPAEFEGEGSEFTFDFQIESYRERADREIVHFYGAWRFLHLGVLGDSSDDAFITTTLDSMIEWDQMTDEHCAQ